VLATASALALAAAGVVTTGSAEPASALQGCPSPVGQIVTWAKIYSQRGVTMCRGLSSAGMTMGYLQLVSLGDGAVIRVESKLAASGPSAPSPDTQFDKHDVASWDSWIPDNDPTILPYRLFSETNASYFINDNDSFSTTELSMPEHRGWATTTNGYALGHHSNPAWNAPKKALIIDSPQVTPQYVNIQDFPTHYTSGDVASMFDGFQDGLVAYRTDTGANGPDTRTFLAVSPPPAGPGFPQQTVYILTVTGMTLTESQAILNSAGVFGTEFSMQLDGGGSVGMHSDVAEFGPSVHGRLVPDVIAVFLAP
jgi:hypothetical protein